MTAEARPIGRRCSRLRSPSGTCSCRAAGCGRTGSADRPADAERRDPHVVGPRVEARPAAARPLLGFAAAFARRRPAPWQRASAWHGASALAATLAAFRSLRLGGAFVRLSRRRAWRRQPARLRRRRAGSGSSPRSTRWARGLAALGPPAGPEARRAAPAGRIRRPPRVPRRRATCPPAGRPGARATVRVDAAAATAETALDGEHDREDRGQGASRASRELHAPSIPGARRRIDGPVVTRYPGDRSRYRCGRVRSCVGWSQYSARTDRSRCGAPSAVCCPGLG